MTAEEFFDLFVSETATEISLDAYKQGGAAFTRVMTNVINAIIKHMGYNAENEYYRIDAIGWVDKKADIVEEASHIGLNPHLWDLKIAVEHENDLMDWMDELIKLVHICCPLKVVIGYQHYDCRQEPEVEKLAYAAKCMQRVNAFGRGRAQHEQYLIILGNAMGLNHRSDYQSFDYCGYLFNFDTNSFDRLRK